RSVRQEAAGGYRVLAMRREPDRVIAEIEYVPEQDRSVWTVVKRGHVWLVDAEQTARALGAGL
ncbi:MAG: hypothetical protein HY248_00890, partial [Fimbriimonas ginsengisoli]|nr:hypothetical protein [Fimbriimonas ginsengisoli]